LRIINNSLLNNIYGPKREEVIGDWRKLHDEEPHDLYSVSNSILVMTQRKMARAGHVTRMGEIKDPVVGKPDEKHHLQGLSVQMRTISK